MLKFAIIQIKIYHINYNLLFFLKNFNLNQWKIV